MPVRISRASKLCGSANASRPRKIFYVKGLSSARVAAPSETEASLKNSASLGRLGRTFQTFGTKRADSRKSPEPCRGRRGVRRTVMKHRRFLVSTIARALRKPAGAWLLPNSLSLRRDYRSGTSLEGRTGWSISVETQKTLDDLFDAAFRIVCLIRSNNCLEHLSILFSRQAISGPRRCCNAMLE